MRILLVTYWYLPHTGGVHTYLRLLRKGLRDTGHHVDILAHHPEMNHLHVLDTKQKIEKKPLLYPVHELMMDYYDKALPHLDHWVRYRDIERYVFELAAVLTDLERYDIIHTQDVISTRALSRVKPDHIRHVATIHGFLMEEFFVTKEIEREGSMRWKYSFIEETLGATSADATILPSEWLRREYMNRIGVSDKRMEIIPYGLDTEAILAQLKKERPVEKHRAFTIICPARLVPYKGQRYLIEALAKLKRRDEHFLCLFAGDGPQKKELQALAKRRQLEQHVRFLGNRSDIYRLYLQSDLFVLPTLVENHSLAVMEAQLVGMPVITTRVGGNAELIVPEHTGILVEPRDDDQLCEAIFRIKHDPFLRNHLSQISRRWALKYWSADRMIDRTERLYHKVLHAERESRKPVPGWIRLFKKWFGRP